MFRCLSVLSADGLGQTPVIMDTWLYFFTKYCISWQGSRVAAVGTTLHRNKLQQMSHFLEKKSIFYNLLPYRYYVTKVCTGRSRAEYLTSDKLTQWKFGQPQTSEVPRTISPQAANLQNNTQTPWNLWQIGSWFWLWVLYGIVTKTWQVHSSPILVFEEKMFGSSSLCRIPE